MDKETKKFNLVPLYPSKSLWDFNKKEECNNIFKEWCMTSKSLDLKRRNFLHLLNNNLSEIKPSYTKGGPWLEHIGFSNLLCAWATQAITNHVPIGEYCLKFFSREEFKCLCRLYPIESKNHILYECRWFKKYWNLMRDTISQFISFLEFNLNAFSFRGNITWTSISPAWLVFFYFSPLSFPFSFSFSFSPI